METLELFYPQSMARAGAYSLDQGIEFEIFSAKSSYFDWAKIRFTEQFQPEISLARKDPAAIELGYNGVTEEVFTGFVARPYNKGGGADEITLKDEMLLLEDTQINNTFLDTTPQEVISYVLAQAGVGKKKLNAQGFPTRKKLPIRQMSGVQAINAVNAAWSLKEQFFFSGGVFYWGEKPEQQKVYTFEYGVNIINLVRLGGRVGVGNSLRPLRPALPQDQRHSPEDQRGAGGHEGRLVHQRRRLHPYKDLFLRRG